MFRTILLCVLMSTQNSVAAPVPTHLMSEVQRGSSGPTPNDPGVYMDLRGFYCFTDGNTGTPTMCYEQRSSYWKMVRGTPARQSGTWWWYKPDVWIFHQTKEN